MASRIISIPFVIIFFGALYLAWEKDKNYATYMIPCVVILGIIYALSPQIDWWWYEKHPPSLDPPFEKQLSTYFNFYKNLDEVGKKKFRDRTALYLFANEFRAPNEETVVPEDFRSWIAAHAVQVAFGQKEFLMPKFETIIVYSKAFPSPQFPKHLHASEIFEEDGVLLIGAEPMLRGILKPNEYYNITLYEYAKIFALSYPNYRFPSLEDNDKTWAALEAISGKNKAWVTQCLGLPTVDIQAVAVHHFFQYAERFKEVLPQVYVAYQDIFSPSVRSNGQ
jgi:Glucose-regulated metallo-peptidase M90